MALKLYRRHRKDCEAGHPEDTKSGEFEEGRRGWKRCACQIHATGTLNGKFNRKTTGATTWDEARNIAKQWEERGTWTDTRPAPAVVIPEQAPCRVTIDEAITTYLGLRENDNIAPATLRKYRVFTKQLKAYADNRGYVMLDQFTPADIDAFYTSMNLDVRTKAKRLGTLRAFFRHCVNREWLAKNPVSQDLKPPKGANNVANKIPFTDEELRRIITACDKLEPVTWKSGKGTGRWTGEDAKDFIWLMLHTGLRISDVALFTTDRMQGNNVFLRAKKNGGDVFAYLPDWLVQRLHERAKKHGKQLFILGDSTRLDTITDTWRRKLHKIFDIAGFNQPTPGHKNRKTRNTSTATPHRFRHTFARILLQRGVPVSDVAELLGDDERTVREHYSRWVPERQARLTKILQDAFEDTPKPKTVAIR